MSCNAAVKVGNHLSAMEANELIDQQLKLDNPYACPHGRPTIISMSRYELEKKYKRIVKRRDHDISKTASYHPNWTYG